MHSPDREGLSKAEVVRMSSQLALRNYDISFVNNKFDSFYGEGFYQFESDNPDYSILPTRVVGTEVFVNFGNDFESVKDQYGEDAVHARRIAAIHDPRWLMSRVKTVGMEQGEDTVILAASLDPVVHGLIPNGSTDHIRNTPRSHILRNLLTKVHTLSVDPEVLQERVGENIQHINNLSKMTERELQNYMVNALTSPWQFRIQLDRRMLPTSFSFSGYPYDYQHMSGEAQTTEYQFEYTPKS